MSHSPDQKTHCDSRTDQLLRRILHWMERLIAFVTLAALAVALARDIYEMALDIHHFDNVSHLLHNLLNIVVGLEFVRMLIDTTPANILEVLALAITRHVVLAHDNAWSNLLSVLCIAVLFAVRRFLIRPSELGELMVEDDEAPGCPK